MVQKLLANSSLGMVKATVVTGDKQKKVVEATAAPSKKSSTSATCKSSTSTTVKSSTSKSSTSMSSTSTTCERGSTSQSSTSTAARYGSKEEHEIWEDFWAEYIEEEYEVWAQQADADEEDVVEIDKSWECEQADVDEEENLAEGE